MENNLTCLKELEEVLNIEFENTKLLEEAITHSSYANHKHKVKYYERLEFLGDSVLQLCITEYLFSKFKNKTEGDLTKLRALIVCENSLHHIAQSWNLGKYLRMSRGEELTGGRTRVSILADCVESVIAAVYLDKGLEVARNLILKNFKDIMDKAGKNEIILDYKTALQEKLQQKGEVAIEYSILSFEGPPHRRKFYVAVSINGVTKGKGEGFSKKEAEQSSAKEALATL